MASELIKVGSMSQQARASELSSLLLLQLGQAWGVRLWLQLG